MSKKTKTDECILQVKMNIPATSGGGRDRYSGSDLVIPPLVVARMLRAARGEHVELGRLLFLGAPSLKEQGNEIADVARKLMDLCRAGSALRGQVEAGLEADKERRHQVAVIKDELLGGNIDAALEQLGGLLASWGG